jgi:hypothetical protein
MDCPPIVKTFKTILKKKKLRAKILINKMINKEVKLNPKIFETVFGL